MANGHAKLDRCVRCVRFLLFCCIVVIFIPAMRFYLFLFFPAKILFLTRAQARVTFDALSRQRPKIDAKTKKSHFFMICEVQRIFDPILNFELKIFFSFKNAFRFFNSKILNWGTVTLLAYLN